MISLSHRLALWAAKNPRSEVAALVLEASEALAAQLERIRELEAEQRP